MRFKKGSKVEVLNRREVPSGSWWYAEIISGNGHNYYVRYDRYPSDMVIAVERVPRKAIRPCPPPVEGPRSWVPGDIVEVFDNYSWKLAEVSRVVGGNYFIVRLLGSSTEFRARSSDIRLRQSWQDNKWVVIRKDLGKCSDEMINKPSKEGKFLCEKTQPCLEENNCAGDGHFTFENDNVFVEFPRDFTKGMKKRQRLCSVPVETCTGASRKMGAIEKEGRRYRLVAGLSPKLPEKVDAVASPQKMLGEKYMHASINNRTTGFSDTQRGEGITNVNDDCYFRVSLEPSDTESVSSSVGSCSASNSPYRSLHYPINGLTQDLDSSSDAAETSSSWSGREPSLPTKEALAEEIHRLELHAYRTTMVALYASGPISWDQEALMTNLRLMLHISNDEHLLELRNLVSAEKVVPFR